MKVKKFIKINNLIKVTKFNTKKQVKLFISIKIKRWILSYRQAQIILNKRQEQKSLIITKLKSKIWIKIFTEENKKYIRNYTTKITNTKKTEIITKTAKSATPT